MHNKNIPVKDESTRPVRWTKFAKTVGAMGLLATGTVAGVASANQVHADNHHHNVVRELEQGRGAVQSEINDGRLSPADITMVPAPEGGYVSDVAHKIVGQGHDSSEVQDIMSAQTNGTNVVEQGEEFVLPTGDVPAAPTGSAQK